jgi:hypothetical protein
MNISTRRDGKARNSSGLEGESKGLGGKKLMMKE